MVFPLFGYAVRISIGTENTTITGKGPDGCAATGALMVDHSGINGNLLVAGKPALRTGDQRFKFELFQRFLASLRNNNLLLDVLRWYFFTVKISPIIQQMFQDQFLVPYPAG